VSDAAASLADSILKCATAVNVLATSRQPTGAEGEAVQRLGPLGTPSRESKLTAAVALTFPSVQLFVERAAT